MIGSPLTTYWGTRMTDQEIIAAFRLITDGWIRDLREENSPHDEQERSADRAGEPDRA